MDRVFVQPDVIGGALIHREDTGIFGLLRRHGYSDVGSGYGATRRSYNRMPRHLLVPIFLCAYALPGTDVAYRATRSMEGFREVLAKAVVLEVNVYPPTRAICSARY